MHELKKIISVDVNKLRKECVYSVILELYMMVLMLKNILCFQLSESGCLEGIGNTSFTKVGWNIMLVSLSPKVNFAQFKHAKDLRSKTRKAVPLERWHEIYFKMAPLMTTFHRRYKSSPVKILREKEQTNKSNNERLPEGGLTYGP